MSIKVVVVMEGLTALCGEWRRLSGDESPSWLLYTLGLVFISFLPPPPQGGRGGPLTRRRRWPPQSVNSKHVRKLTRVHRWAPDWKHWTRGELSTQEWPLLDLLELMLEMGILESGQVLAAAISHLTS